MSKYFENILFIYQSLSFLVKGLYIENKNKNDILQNILMNPLLI